MKTLNNVDIKQVRGHWECHIDGKFFCSGDTFDEIMDEIIEEFEVSCEASNVES